MILILTLFIPGLQGTTNGLEVSAFIFLFVIGLNTFKENFGMFLQNGVSRKTIFAGKLLSTCAVCAIMAVVLEVLASLAKLGSGYRDIQLGTLYEMLYSDRMASISPRTYCRKCKTIQSSETGVWKSSLRPGSLCLTRWSVSPV